MFMGGFLNCEYRVLYLRICMCICICVFVYLCIWHWALSHFLFSYPLFPFFSTGSTSKIKIQIVFCAASARYSKQQLVNPNAKSSNSYILRWFQMRPWPKKGQPMVTWPKKGARLLVTNSRRQSRVREGERGKSWEWKEERVEIALFSPLSHSSHSYHPLSHTLMSSGSPLSPDRMTTSDLAPSHPVSHYSAFSSLYCWTSCHTSY